jgi:hypothetical protein
VRAALGSYVGHLKSGEAIIQIYLTLLPVHSHISIGDSSALYELNLNVSDNCRVHSGHDPAHGEWGGEQAKAIADKG